MRDFYSVLGVDKSISQKDLKKQYYKLAKKYHPDTFELHERLKAEEKFKRITEAYEVLSNPEKRRRYDNPGMNFNFGSGFNTYNPISKKQLILDKMKKGNDFSIIELASELRVEVRNLEKIIIAFITKYNFSAYIWEYKLIFTNSV